MTPCLVSLVSIMEREDISKRCYDALMGPRTDAAFKRIALWAALVGFALHLLIWALVQGDLVVAPAGIESLLGSPLLALYTPFSILLVYEVYQFARVRF